MFGKQKIRPGHSVCCLSSDQGHMDVQSPCDALPLVKNNSSISQVMQTDAVDQGKEKKPQTLPTQPEESPHIEFTNLEPECLIEHLQKIQGLRRF